MIRNAVRRRLHRLIALFGVSLLAAGTAVVLTGAPAQAAFVYKGTFRISSGLSCLEVHGDNTADRTPIILGPCDSGNNQRWAIFLLTDQNNYQIMAYGGAFPLNKCMDGPNSSSVVHIFGCHGGSQQRWTLPISTTSSQQIRQAGTNECLGIIGGPFLITAAQLSCGAIGTTWNLVPA